MSADRTQQQSDEELRQSSQLSRQQARPPSDVPGYEPQKLLGSGAYGEVWVAVDQNTGRQVAIKFYTHRGGLDWSLLSREVEKLVFLSADRYVVQLLDVGWNAEPPYYVMEYVENGSLDDYLQQQGRLPIAEAVQLCRDVAIGLVHAHGKGVLHCDLKPANVLLDQDHKPRLADFGQSRLSHEQTPALGTLFYMAPEQADLDALPDARWDVYALGALLYCMLTGEPPYRSEEAVSQIDQAGGLEDRLARYRNLIAQSPRPSAHRQLPGIDSALVDLIDRSLATDPNRRLPNVQEVLDALGAREQARARRPLLTLGFVGPVLLLLIMTLFGWRAYTRAIDDSGAEVTGRVKQSNQFAAKFVAGMVAAEIERYYRAAEQVADDPEFQQLLAKTIQHKQLAQIVKQLGDSEAEAAAVSPLRQKFIDHQARQELQCRLQELMDDARRPKAASWFTTDAEGMQLAAVFNTQPKFTTIGKYYGWRTYYHGGPIDLPSDDRADKPAPITHTHLSAVFQSQATNAWKIAISTPVVREGQLLGVVALTVEMGHIMKFPGSQKQFAVLVDSRPGQHTGVILQHPLFDTVLKRQKKLPERFSTYRVLLGQQPPSEGRLEPRYRDPLAEDKQGAAYRKDWIAAQAAVQLAGGRAGDHSGQEAVDTGLVVLVQEDYDAAIQPMQRLGRRMVREWLLGLGVVIAVVALLWYVVLRGIRRPSGPLPRPRQSYPPPSPLGEMTTLPAHGRPRKK